MHIRRVLGGVPSLFILLAFLSAVSGAASAALEPIAPKRAIVRVSRRDDGDWKPLLRLGLDVAGSGPGGSLDLILDVDEIAQVRALGFLVTPLATPGREAPLAAQSPLMKPGLGAYHTYSEAHAEMATYVAAHPTLALLDTIGTSIEGRPIEAVKISDNVAAQENEPEVLIVGCHHARELMGVELPLYLMRRLLDGYGSDPVIASLVNGRQVWIVPILNPDGYVYVEQNSSGLSDGWWRKNRRLNWDGSYGVDLNRNYAYQWGFDDFGSSPTPSSEVYRGTGPFSEPETAAFRDFIAAHQFRISASFHSYGDLVLYPWGYELADTPDHPIFEALGDSIASQNGYLAGNPKSGAIYVTNGDMDDWVYGDTTTKPRMIGFTFELNTASEGGFAPNDALIAPTCDLNWGPLLTILRYGDSPRRVLPPPRSTAPVVAGIPGIGWALHWGYPAPDPQNLPVRHDLRRIGGLTRMLDDAETGTADWDTTLFAWSTARSASGTHSYWSGSGDSRSSVLASRVAADVAPGDSVVAKAYWDLEADRDYWYAEASQDGGVTWTSLPGDRTTNDNIFGRNLGNGITGASGGVFSRVAFSLQSFAGTQALVRFRCLTDASVHREGLYIDDVTPVVRESNVTVTDTASPDTSYLLPATPSSLTYYQVRAVDAEGQTALWSARGLFDPAITAVASIPAPGATYDRLGPTVPNPFNPRTEIGFTLGRGDAGPYRLDVFDVAGRPVAIAASGWDGGQGATRAAAWDGRDARGSAVGSGVYLFRLESVRGVQTRKATLLR